MALDVLEQPVSVSVKIAVKEPEVETEIELSFEALLHVMLLVGEAVKVTDPPWQNVVVVNAEITGAVGRAVTLTIKESVEVSIPQKPALVA
jgi:hypothetical protein